MVAASPFVNPVPFGYISIRLLRLSATHTFLDVSIANLYGFMRVIIVAVVPDLPVVKLDCPNTMVAASPFVNPVSFGYISADKIRIPKKTATIDIVIIEICKIFMILFMLYRHDLKNWRIFVLARRF